MVVVAVTITITVVVTVVVAVVVAVAVTIGVGVPVGVPVRVVVKESRPSGGVSPKGRSRSEKGPRNMDSVEQADDPVRDWVFTFGDGQRGFSASVYRPPMFGVVSGFPLDDRYVVIRGTHDEARLHMVGMFGVVWCGQYPDLESAGVDEFHLVELLSLTANPEGDES